MKIFSFQKKLIFLLLITLFLSECSSITKINSTQSFLTPTLSAQADSLKTTNTLTPTLAEAIRNTPYPTQTLLPSSTVTQAITNISDVTATQQINLQLREKCLTIKPSLDNIPDDIIVLKGGVELDLVFIKMADNSRKGIGGTVRGSLGISPNLDKIAYIDAKLQRLFIIDSRGEQLQSIPTEKNWTSVIHWAEDDLLLIENMPFHDDGTYNPPASSIVYNLSTLKIETEYLHDFPGQFFIGNGAPEWGPYYFSQSVFDPIFSRVIYPAYEDAEGVLVFRNLENQGEVARYWVGDPDYGGLPQWSRDGSYVITGIYPIYERWDGTRFINIHEDLPYKGGYDLFRLSRDGEIERLTYLTTRYKAMEKGYTLSPEEKRIAFWLFLDYDDSASSNNQHLALLNIETGVITNLCLLGSDYAYPPIWSPDGDYLIVTLIDNVINGKIGRFEMILVDLQHETASKIADQVYGMGWLKKEQP